MNYDEFKTKYEALVAAMMSYSPDQVGANIYAGKLADLVEKYPEFEELYDAEAA